MTNAMLEVKDGHDGERPAPAEVLGRGPFAGGKNAGGFGSIPWPTWRDVRPWVPVALAGAGVPVYLLLDHLNLLTPSLRDRPWPFELLILAAWLQPAGRSLVTSGRARVSAMVSAGLIFAFGVALIVIGRHLSHTLPQTPAELAAGRTLPPLFVLDERGREVDLSSLRGQPTVVLVYRSAYCASCSAQLHRLAAQARPFLDVGVRDLAISPDPPEVAAALRDRARIPFPVLSDEHQTATAVLCGGGSHCELLLDGHGAVRWGAFSDNWRELPEQKTVLQAGYRLQ